VQLASSDGAQPRHPGAAEPLEDDLGGHEQPDDHRDGAQGEVPRVERSDLEPRDLDAEPLDERAGEQREARGRDEGLAQREFL